MKWTQLINLYNHYDYSSSFTRCVCLSLSLSLSVLPRWLYHWLVIDILKTNEKLCVFFCSLFQLSSFHFVFCSTHGKNANCIQFIERICAYLMVIILLSLFCVQATHPFHRFTHSDKDIFLPGSCDEARESAHFMLFWWAWMCDVNLNSKTE